MFPGWWRRPDDVVYPAEEPMGNRHTSLTLCRGVEDDHTWERTCTTVVPGKPLIVEYMCRRCGLWTVEQTTDW